MAGETRALIGESGSRKSTVGRLVLGLLHPTPVEQPECTEGPVDHRPVAAGHTAACVALSGNLATVEE